MFVLLLTNKDEITSAKQRLKDKADELGVRLGKGTEKVDKLFSAICNVPNIDTLTALAEGESQPYSHVFNSQIGLIDMGFDSSGIVMPEPAELKDGNARLFPVVNAESAKKLIDKLPPHLLDLDIYKGVDVELPLSSGKTYPVERLDEESLKSLEVSEKPLTVSVNDLLNLKPRTLLYGYDGESHTCHLYLDDNSLLNYIVYERWTKTIIKHEQGAELEVNSIIPPKRTYPHKSCREFAELIFSLGKRISFCGYDKIEPQDFYGYKKEELSIAYKGYKTFQKTLEAFRNDISMLTWYKVIAESKNEEPDFFSMTKVELEMAQDELTSEERSKLLPVVNEILEHVHKSIDVITKAMQNNVAVEVEAFDIAYYTVEYYKNLAQENDLDFLTSPTTLSHKMRLFQSAMPYSRPIKNDPKAVEVVMGMFPRKNNHMITDQILKHFGQEMRAIEIDSQEKATSLRILNPKGE